MNFQQIKYKSVLVIALLILNIGCTSGELDFDQSSNFETKPVYKVYINDFIPKLDVKIPQIPLTGNSITITKTIDVFDTTLFDNTINKAELNFSITNKINSSFTIEIQLNQGTVEFDKISITVPAAQSGADFDLTSPKLYPKEKITQLKKVDNINVKIICGNMSASTSEILTMKTLLTVYIEP
ncbi:MAG: hypothetical protein KA210_01820 [Bacteroidia bacterium]|nr:hypothetical protein [Bacteroidia bacterium]